MVILEIQNYLVFVLFTQSCIIVIKRVITLHVVVVVVVVMSSVLHACAMDGIL